jgi:hypothetical protein
LLTRFARARNSFSRTRKFPTRGNFFVLPEFRRSFFCENPRTEISGKFSAAGFLGFVLDVRTRGRAVLWAKSALEIRGTWPLFSHFVRNSFFFSELRPGKNHFSHFVTKILEIYFSIFEKFRTFFKSS